MNVVVDRLQTVRDGTLLGCIRVIAEVVPVLNERQHFVCFLARVVALKSSKDAC